MSILTSPEVLHKINHRTQTVDLENQTISFESLYGSHLLFCEKFPDIAKEIELQARHVAIDDGYIDYIPLTCDVDSLYNPNELQSSAITQHAPAQRYSVKPTRISIYSAMGNAKPFMPPYRGRCPSRKYKE